MIKLQLIVEVIYTALWISNNEVPPEQWLLHADDSVFSVFSVILQRVKGKNKANILFTFYGKNISNLNVTLQKWIIFTTTVLKRGSRVENCIVCSWRMFLCFLFVGLLQPSLKQVMSSTAVTMIEQQMTSFPDDTPAKLHLAYKQSASRIFRYFIALCFGHHV